MSIAEINVLLIEDDPLSAGLTNGWLKREKAFDFKLHWRTSYADALELVQKQSMDIVILDLDLPDSAEEETINRIHSLSEKLPVIVFSSSGDMAIARKAVEQGAQEFFLKGHIDATLLCRSIVLALDRHKAHQNLQNSLFRDDLTGLHKKAFFLDFAEKKLQYARRKNTEHTLMMCEVLDISNGAPQQIPPDSDLLGSAANVLRRAFRSSDLIARWGGSTFVVLAMDSDFGGSRVVEKRLQTMLYDLHMIANFGFVIYDPLKPRPLRRLMETAEQTLEEEKQRGRNRTQDRVSRLSGTRKTPEPSGEL